MAAVVFSVGLDPGSWGIFSARYSSVSCHVSVVKLLDLVFRWSHMDHLDLARDTFGGNAGPDRAVNIFLDVGSFQNH